MTFLMDKIIFETLQDKAVKHC